jgi:hypothetical protein
MARPTCLIAPFATLAAAALIGAGATGCARGTVRIPETDPTAPLSALDVVGSGERMVLFSGEGPKEVSFTEGDSLVLIGLGEDRDGGVKDLTLSGKAVAYCADSLGRGREMRLGSFARRQVAPAPPGRRAAGSRVARYVLKAEGFRKLCGPGELKAVTGAAGVRTVNYHGKSALSPTLEFRITAVTPPPSDPGRATRTASAEGGPAAQSPQGAQETGPVYGPLPAESYLDTPRI